MSVRVYVPTTLPGLRELVERGTLGPPPLEGFAVTPALRESYRSGDDEELEYAAMTEAARGSLRLLAKDPDAPRKRAVLAVDVPPASVRTDPAAGGANVTVTEAVPLRAVASAHVDAADAAGDVTAAVAALAAADDGDDDAAFTVEGAEAHELGWYARQEISALVELEG